MLADFLLHIDLDVQLLYLLPQGIDTILFLSALPLLHGHRHRCLLLFLLYFAQNCVLFVAKELAFAALFIVAFTQILAFDVLLYILAVLLLSARVGKRKIIPQVILVAICGPVAPII